MRTPANCTFPAGCRAAKTPVTFIAVIALAILAVWGAATYLVSLPLSLDDAVLLR